THHQRHNVRLGGHDWKACRIEYGLDARGTVLMTVALPLRGLEVPDRRGRRGTDRWREGGGEDESRRVGAYRIGDGGAPRDIAAETAKSLRQRALDHVDAVQGPFPCCDAGAAWPVHAGRMHLVDIGHGAVALRQVADLAHGSDVAVHRVERFEHDQ